MLKNYITIALRNLWRDKTSTFVNLLGLSVGMACCMLIVIYIKDELNFNTFNTKIDRIYRVNRTSHVQGENVKAAVVPIPLGEVIANEIPQVQSVARLYQRSGAMEVKLQNGRADKKFQEQNVNFVENSLFDIFSFEFLQGNKSNALSAPNRMVITDEMARKYFGTDNVIGKTLLYDTKTPIQISGVIKKVPENSDLRYDFLISFETLFNVEIPEVANYLKNDWTYDPSFTFCLLKPGAQPQRVEAQINQLHKKYGDSRKGYYDFWLQPLKDLHLYAADVQMNPSTGSIAYVYIFSAISLLILLIANFNFINLATARAGKRSREVGMRKVLGANKKQLIMQFLGETLVLSFFALIISLWIIHFSLPLLNSLTGKHLNTQAWLAPSVLAVFALIFCITGILSGLYPAFFITRFDPVMALKGRSGEVRTRNTVRKVLLVTQFSVSVILIIGAIVIYRQLEFMRNKPLGFKKEQVLVVPVFGSGASGISYSIDGPMRQRMNAFSNELTKFSKIKSVTAASAMPGQGYIPGLIVPEGFRETDNMFAPWISVDYNFTDALEIPVVAGRTFSKATGTDHLNAFILSESAVRFIGWKSPADAIGKRITRGDEANGKKGTVIGVVKDHNFNTLDQPMQPLIMDVAAMRFTQFAINIQPDAIPATIDFISKTWNDFFPERVFEYSFLDSDINLMYRDKENLARVIEYFAGIAILLSCLGLFSLASFMSLQRTKEIGIRKVLGAGVPGILSLLSRDFLKLVLIALLIAVPVGWYLVRKWLDNYAYRIDIDWWIFAVSGGAVILITIVTVSLQSIKAAMTNPVKSLRTE